MAEGAADAATTLRRQPLDAALESAADAVARETDAEREAAEEAEEWAWELRAQRMAEREVLGHRAGWQPGDEDLVPDGDLHPAMVW